MNQQTLFDTTPTNRNTFDIATHNGCITIRSKATGEHRTVRIKTQSDDSNFFPGRRLVELLEGPDNESSYRAFGYLTAGPVGIVLWRKHRDSKFYRWLALFLLDPDLFLDRVEVNFEGRCRRCNRKLTTPESVRLGIGPVCRGDE